MDTDHITKEEFLLEFFGNFGRELGNPPFDDRKRYFTQNPNDIFECIDFATKNKLPAFISVNPFEKYDKVMGIEKIYFDFDIGKKKEIVVLKEWQIRKRETRLLKEVEVFLRIIKQKFRIIPLVIKTRRGFHVHIFLNKVYSLSIDDEEVLKEVYNQLQIPFIKSFKRKYRFMDDAVLGDVKRFCRIPTSIHQENGLECYLVEKIQDGKIYQDKFRGLSYYRDNGLKSDDWLRAVDRARAKIIKDKADRLKAQQEHKNNWEVVHGFVGEIRYCFRHAMECGEAGHQLRLALLLEGYWSGHKTVESLIDLYRNFHDFDEKKTREQISWFFKNKVPDIEKSRKWKPYRCSTLRELNICLQDDCPLYIWKKEKGNQR